MPNRILRDWTCSEKIGELSVHSERFFTRLIMKVDDFGCFTANVKLLKSSLFPLLIDEVREADIIRWTTECHKAGIIVLYEIENKRYLQIIDFKQRLRQANSKYPQPLDGQMSDTRQPIDGLKGNEEETEEETETELLVWPSFDDFWNKYDKKVDRPKCELKFKKLNQEARLKIMQHLDDYILSTPDKNYRKNPETYLTKNSWENEIITPQKTYGTTIDKRAAGIRTLQEDFANRVVGGNSQS